MADTGKVLRDRLDHLSWLLHKQQQRRHTKANPVSDPTKGQGRILAMLKLKDAISTKDLAFLLDVRVSSLNEMLYKMERGGYIMREADPADRRVMLVHLTDKGRDEQQSDSMTFTSILDCLSKDEQDELCRYLDRLIGAFEAEMEPGDEDFYERMKAIRERVGDKMMDRLERHLDWHRSTGIPSWPGTGGWPGGRDKARED
jgi:DNA-binding MarR family transcriptional regulator